VAENATLVGTLSATDANGDAITNYTFSDGATTSPDGMFEIVNNGGTW
jgi:hypothetical protein